MPIPSTLVDRLYLQANADEWRVEKDQFAAALETSVQRASAGRDWTPRDCERYLVSLHLEDLALACACAAGDDSAWEHFVLVQRPHLYRAADALDAAGGARDLADSLYAELFGLRERGGERQSLFRYFHGRSSLTTWLRTILSQRYIDRWREARRAEPLPDEESNHPLGSVPEAPDLERPRLLKRLQDALKRAVANLVARDRLRLACYYAQQMTLAETARLLGEHEATSSRHLARTRRLIRHDIERQFRVEQRLTEAEIRECFASATADPGPLDLREILEPAEPSQGIDR